MRKRSLRLNKIRLACVLVASGIMVCVTTYIALFCNRTGIVAASSCLDSSGAANVGAVQTACNSCGSGGARGALWFNGSGDNKNSDIVKVSDPTASQVTIYLWGQVYSCNTSGTSANNATHIWFAAAGQDTGNSSSGNLPNKVDFLSPNNATTSLNRGSGQGQTHTWYSPKDNKQALTLDLKKFKSYSGTKCSQNGSTERCEATVSVNRCFNDPFGYYANPKPSSYTGELNKPCYGDDSKIILEIAGGSTSSNFGAWSWVDTSSTGQDPDKTVSTTKTTSEKQVTVAFKHQLAYDRPSGDFSGASFGAAETKWRAEITKDGSVIDNTKKDGTYRVENGYPSEWRSWSSTLAEQQYTVDVPEEGSVKVCSTIYYDPKNISWKESSSSKYEVDSTANNASSQACVTISASDTKMEDGGQLRFYSTSTIKIPAQNDDVSSHEETSESNEMVTAKLSTKGEKLSVDFSHDLYTVHEARGGGAMGGDSNPDADTLVDQACTKYSVLQSSPTLNSMNKMIADLVDHCVSGVGHSNWASTKKTVSSTEKVEIKLNPGDIVTVCQRINFSPTIITLNRVRFEHEEFDDYYPVSSFNSSNMQRHYYYDEFHHRYDMYELVYYDNDGEAQEVSMWDLTDFYGNPIVVYEYDSDGKPIRYNLSNKAAYIFIDGKRYRVYHAVYKMVFDRYDYYVEGENSDSGYSGACIEVTRPLEPSTSDDTGNGTGDASPGSDPMYAGEQSQMVWNANATSYASHRIMKAQAVAYQIKVDKKIETEEDKKISKGSTPSAALPCTWYEGKVSPEMLRYKCTVIKEDNYGSSGFYGDPKADYSFGEGTQFIVTNNVGDKHCNAFGIQWEYWYGVVRWTGTTPPGDIISEEWSPEGKSYWTVYDAICKPILKKPSASIWNGGLITNGSVKTSLSNRYTGDDLGFANTNLQSTHLKFGSWTEYLAVVGREVSGSPFGFSSGAALGGNGSIANATLLDNSPLTIANTGNQDNKIGNSGISSNSTYRARLSSYLLSGAETGVDVNSLQNVEGTKIIRVDGDVNITAPRITVKDANYNTIYQLPQIVIYATGNINIGSNVEQIDAWLISGGTVNTCSNFANGSTEARVSGYNSGTDCSKQLTINGPIIAKNVIPNRSAGADPITYGVDGRVGGDARATSGEVFNLSADTYLWAYAQAGRYDSSYSEAYTRELPPRY